MTAPVTYDPNTGTPVTLTSPLVDDSAAQGPANISAINGAGTPAPQLSGTLNASQDNTITFAAAVRRVLLHNQSAVNVPFEHDIAAVATSPYLAPGQLVAFGVHTTVLHVFPGNALPINAANGLIVRGWL